ncbi:MAG: GNAT family N-acetyltransferase, partial [Rhodospirillaceae bacterium]
MATLEKARLTIRNAKIADIDGIRALMKTVYPDMPSYSADMLRGQIANFMEGQFVALYDDDVIGYCGTFRIDESIALAPHTWVEITGGGFASRHDPTGNMLYGMEVAVDPEYRGLRIGQRFYNERKALCERSRLKGIVFVGRLPGLARRIKEVGTPEEYVRRVEGKKMRDAVLSFQLRNGFEIVSVLPEYLPSDRASLG